MYPSAEHGLRIEYYISLVISIILILIYAKSLFSKSFLRKFKPELTGLTIFLSAIVIFLPLYWSRTVFITERYAYIPYIGLSVFFVSLLFRITQRIERQISNLPAYLLIVVAIALGISTYVRIDVWKNPYTLFSDVVKNDRSTREVSMGLYNIGNEHLRNKNYIEAKKKYNLSIQLNDKYAEAYYNRGITNFFQKYHSEAIHDFTSALHLGGNPAMILINRAEAYRNLGKINEAYSDLCEAILSDNTGLALFSRGLLLYFSLNDQGSACADWKVSASLGNMDAKKFLITYCNQN
ncbi:MAG: hypothetical protein KKA07_03185 [Bacteroidetes bacterium]|nr:hypothetical protein [Bacteroidota bacterium]